MLFSLFCFIKASVNLRSSTPKVLYSSSQETSGELIHYEYKRNGEETEVIIQKIEESETKLNIVSDVQTFTKEEKAKVYSTLA